LITRLKKILKEKGCTQKVKRVIIKPQKIILKNIKDKGDE
tara:strand:+ start:290 stop:409 length:120 start_codon:yes stop_codon:yes gene_type:complete